MTDRSRIKDPLKREAAAIEARGPIPQRPFVHLRVHSAYSLLEGALPLKKIVGHAIKDNMAAIAVTDTNNLFGALEFAQYASKDGVQPIIGCQVDIAFEETGSPQPAQRAGNQQRSHVLPVVLLAATEDGYANLVRLVSSAYLDNAPDAGVMVPLDRLRSFASGVICLTGGERGPIGAALKAERTDVASARLTDLAGIFGDRLYVELQRPVGYDRQVEGATVALAYDFRLPLVATNEAFFPRARRL
jgi:DNA polymerase-3 subunit alpha